MFSVAMFRLWKKQVHSNAALKSKQRAPYALGAPQRVLSALLDGFGSGVQLVLFVIVLCIVFSLAAALVADASVLISVSIFMLGIFIFQGLKGLEQSIREDGANRDAAAKAQRLMMLSLAQRMKQQ
jgi:hypothetical protein